MSADSDSLSTPAVKIRPPMPSSNRKDATPARPTSPQIIKQPKTIDPALRQTSLTTLEISSDDDSSGRLASHGLPSSAISSERNQSNSSIQTHTPNSPSLNTDISSSKGQPQNGATNNAGTIKPKQASVVARYSALKIGVSVFLNNNI